MIRFIALLLLIPSFAFAYTPPKGIPNPADSWTGFGEIDQVTPVRNTYCSYNGGANGWAANEEFSTAESGGSQAYNCYYVDHDATCNDTNANGYGKPDAPICHPPDGVTLVAGSYVYINAANTNPLLATDSSGQYWDLGCDGTASAPCWITGNAVTKPIIRDNLAIGVAKHAHYMIIENLEWNGYGSGTDSLFYIRPYDANGAVDHILIRDCTLTGTATVSDGNAIIAGGAISDVNHAVSDIVVYHNTISDMGVKGAEEENEKGGVIGMKVTNFWVLGNTISGVAEDCIAGCHTCNGEQSNWYIGANVMSDSGANCIDFKEVGASGTTGATIISENICTGPFAKYHNAAGPNDGGFGIVLHYGAASADLVNPWVIFNKVYGANSGVVCTGCKNMYVVGNLFYNIHGEMGRLAGEDETYSLGDVCYGAAVCIRGSDGTFQIVDNTIHDADEGIKINQAIAETDTVKIHGNIISGRSDAARYEIDIDNSGEEYADIDYNFFYGPSGTSAFYWDAGARNFSYMTGTASECSNCKDGTDPGYINATNFRLSSTSAADRDTGVPAYNSVEGPVGGTVYDLFYTTFGTSIEYDIGDMAVASDGIGVTVTNKKPRTTTYWSFGAYEYDAGTILPAHSFGSGATHSFGSGSTILWQ